MPYTSALLNRRKVKRIQFTADYLFVKLVCFQRFGTIRTERNIPYFPMPYALLPYALHYYVVEWWHYCRIVPIADILADRRNAPLWPH